MTYGVRWVGLLLLCGLVLSAASTHAQDNSLAGLLLINSTEIGAIDNPNQLFVVNVETLKVAELRVENDSVFAPWVGWSPSGDKFAFLAPARRGENFELWLADGDADNPVPRSPLFNLDLTVLVADWNPQFNIVAVGTESQDARDGLYLVNANFENVVFLREADIPRAGILDWAHEGDWLAFSTENAALNMINAETETIVTLRSFTQPRPALLPSANTGWVFDDSRYVFSDDIYQFVYAATTDGFSTPTDFDDAYTSDPFGIHLMPNQDRIVTVSNQTIISVDLGTGGLSEIPIQTENLVEDGVYITEDGDILLNSFILLGDDEFAECLLVDADTGEARFIRELVGNLTWGHTQCQLLEGGNHVAIMASDELISFTQLPDDMLYELFILSLDTNRGRLITNQYTGFEQSQIGFSPEREQLVFRQENALVVTNFRGDFKQLVTLNDLDLKSDFVDFEFYWQPQP